MRNKAITIEDYASFIKNLAIKMVGEEKDVSVFLKNFIFAINGKINVLKEPNEYEKNGGSLIIKEDKSFVINLPPYTSPLRDNFTIAHELGHYFIHYMNNNMERTFYRYGNDAKEVSANYFAACFLMPKDDFQKYEQEYKGSILQLSAHFQVPISAIQYRLELLKND